MSLFTETMITNYLSSTALSFNPHFMSLFTETDVLNELKRMVESFNPHFMSLFTETILVLITMFKNKNFQSSFYESVH